MGGKAAIFMVLGFSLIFLVMQQSFGSMSTKALENVIDYYARTNAHQIAVSGANMALNEIFIDNDWEEGFDNVSMNSGILNVSVGNSGSLKQIISEGKFNGEIDSVIIKLQPSNFAKFAWYAGNMSSKQFITGDTVWGPFHTQSKLNIGGDPVFMGKVSTLKGLSPGVHQLAAHGYDPKFYGGYETGVDIPIPTNYQFTEQKSDAQDGVTNHGGASYFENTDVWMLMNSDGTVTYRTGTGSDTSTYSAPVTQSLSSFAPNGVVYVEKGNMYVSGKVNGQVTLVAGESSGAGHGNVYLEDDLTYVDDPMVWNASDGKYEPNNSSTDMLGILASNNVIVANNDHNNHDKDIHVDGAIFCAQGGFQLEDKTIPPSGTVYLRGSMIAAKEEMLAQTDGSGHIKNGYKRNVIFDERLLLQSPIDFPDTGEYEIVSWYE